MKEHVTTYYAANDEERKLDARRREKVKASGDAALMSMFIQNQEILSLLRRARDTKGYPVRSGYMGLDPESGKYMLFATEAEYREYMEEL